MGMILIYLIVLLDSEVLSVDLLAMSETCCKSVRTSAFLLMGISYGSTIPDTDSSVMF